MLRNVLIEIDSTEKRKNPTVKHVQELVNASILKGVRCVRTAPLYRLEGDFITDETDRICRELLCDPVTEKYFIDLLPSDSKTIFADVWYKPGVTDTVGDSILKAVNDLKIHSVKKAFSGIRYEFKIASLTGNGQSPEEKIAAFAGKELLNALVQECKIVKR